MEGTGALIPGGRLAVLKGAEPVAHTENVTRSDGERHLRLVAEQMLLERPGTSLFPVDARLVAAGAALVAVGALAPDAARAIADAYARTLHRRDPARPPLRDPAPPAPADAGGAAQELGRWHLLLAGRSL
jgi:hypothetical protein